MASAWDIPTVLVVDDDQDQREALRDLIREEGFRSVGAKDGAAALGVLRLFTPALIVVDIRMPEVDGFAFDRARCSDPRLANIPEIVISGMGFPDVRLQELGAQFFLRKPIDPRLFARLLRCILQRTEVDAETSRKTTRAALAQG